jgi:hypothetical protein
MPRTWLTTPRRASGSRFLDLSTRGPQNERLPTRRCVADDDRPAYFGRHIAAYSGASAAHEVLSLVVLLGETPASRGNTLRWSLLADNHAGPQLEERRFGATLDSKEEAMNYLDEYDEETLPGFAQCFLVCGQQARFTPIGLKRYKERFQRAAFDVKKITTVEALEAALVGSFHIDMQALAERFERRHAGKNSVEHQLVRAEMRGDEAEMERLLEKLERRNRLGLRAVSATSSDPETELGEPPGPPTTPRKSYPD